MKSFYGFVESANAESKGGRKRKEERRKRKKKKREKIEEGEGIDRQVEWRLKTKLK